MNRRNVLTFLFLVYSLLSSAQLGADYWNLLVEAPKLEILDKAKVEVIYEHMVIDPVLDKRDEGNPLILQIGDNYSKFWEYNQLKEDSALFARGYGNLTMREAYNISKMYSYSHRFVYPQFMLTNYRTGTIKERNYNSGFYEFEEETPVIEWELLEETDSICGYPCSLAGADFKGRKWKAWFTEEIPLSEGPFRFQGLPGLILKMESADGEHRITAIAIRKSDRDIYLDNSAGDYFKTTRERWRKMEKNYKTNPRGTVDTSNYKHLDGSDPRSKMQKRLFYNPVELE